MKFNVIPAIDLLDGKVVRLSQGRYDQVSHYNFSPGDLAKQFEQNGASRIHIVDLDGAKAGRIVNWDAIREIRAAVKCELEIGGGIRSVGSAKELFDSGIQYIILGSLLVKDRSIADTIIEAFPNKVIAGIDCHGESVATEGWINSSNVSLKDLVESLSASCVSAIIFTDISTDGMLCGPNYQALRQLTQLTALPIIASGGIRNIQDVNELRNLNSDGVNGCILGKSILESHISLSDLWKKTN